MSELFPAGDYYIGDLGYVLTEAQWYALPLETHDASWSTRIEEQPLWMGRTAYGDGLYHDQEGFAFGVDSGTIGVVADAVCNQEQLCEVLERRLARVVTFGEPFTTTCDAGRFVIGHLVIDTRGSDESEETP